MRQPWGFRPSHMLLLENSRRVRALPSEPGRSRSSVPIRAPCCLSSRRSSCSTSRSVVPSGRGHSDLAGPIRCYEAIAVVILGLAVNFLCSWWLRDGHQHAHAHAVHHRYHDLNLRAAYVHVITDAATSVLAIFALAGGRFYGAAWLD